MSKKGASYTTAFAFRMALEGRLKTISREQNFDIMRLRKQVAFDRLLARLTTGAPPAIILKAGDAEPDARHDFCTPGCFDQAQHRPMAGLVGN